MFAVNPGVDLALLIQLGHKAFDSSFGGDTLLHRDLHSLQHGKGGEAEVLHAGSRLAQSLPRNARVIRRPTSRRTQRKRCNLLKSIKSAPSFAPRATPPSMYCPGNGGNSVCMQDNLFFINVCQIWWPRRRARSAFVLRP